MAPTAIGSKARWAHRRNGWDAAGPQRLAYSERGILCRHAHSLLQIHVFKILHSTDTFVLNQKADDGDASTQEWLSGAQNKYGLLGIGPCEVFWVCRWKLVVR